MWEGDPYDKTFTTSCQSYHNNRVKCLHRTSLLYSVRMNLSRRLGIWVEKTEQNDATKKEDVVLQTWPIKEENNQVTWTVGDSGPTVHLDTTSPQVSPRSEDIQDVYLHGTQRYHRSLQLRRWLRIKKSQLGRETHRVRFQLESKLSVT